MMSLKSIQEQILAAYQEELSVTEETAKEVISIEREFFYGDRHNTQRLRRIRTLLENNFEQYVKEQEDLNETS